MNRKVIGLEELRATDVAVVGGKAANLGELMRIDGLLVPPGFCVTSDVGLGDIAARVDERVAYAVRSSATMEDLPTASFAGQYETYLNIVGAKAILEHIRRCFASLSSKRAIAYRARSAFDETKAKMAVIVQKMVPTELGGVLFTADPLTGNRKVAKIEAVLGLGEALVSGRVTPTAKLTPDQEARLVALGRRIESHLGRPQDIEWCLDADDRFHIVQSRAITTLFPIPEGADGANRVYLSVGHQQMMTDAMKPLGLSFYMLITPAAMVTAGGRLFVDVTPRLASPASRAQVLAMAGRSDPLTRDALDTVLERGFIAERPDGAAPPAAPAPPPLEADPALVEGLIADAQASIERTRRAIEGKSGAELVDFILGDIQELKRVLLDPRSTRALMSGMEATWWLNERLEAWLGEKNAADALAQSVPNNVTSEMGLALLDVADAMRAHRDERAAMDVWLEKYGMRCVGEIDITRPRWWECPDTLIPLIRHNVEAFEPGEAARRFERGRTEAAKKEDDVLTRLRALPDGEAKAAETKRAIDRVRTFTGYREYPKYAYVSRYWVYKQALMREAASLVSAGAIRDPADIFYFTLQELADVARTNQADAKLIAERRDAFVSFQTLTPPRVLTSDGECVAGRYRRDVPPSALVGLPVSAGTAEGRARIVFDIAEAKLDAGDILVTPFTDPSWTPVFVAIRGLVTEVGGLMTHGAVIAREYGLPAIVGVEHATRRIKDGQRIRVDGTAGYVELL